MRPGQNKRMRGRNNNNNNNRKGPNPLTRSYESNGPDVKIRGTAHHVGEKYLQLARDAHSSGDPVRAESYLQHAEHYFRVIAAAQQAQQAQNGYGRQPGEVDLDDDDEGDDGSMPDRFASPSERVAPQPFGERQPYQNGQNQGYAPSHGGERGQQQIQGERAQGERPQGERPQVERGYDNRNGRNYDNRGHQERYQQDRGFQGHAGQGHAGQGHAGQSNAPQGGSGQAGGGQNGYERPASRADAERGGDRSFPQERPSQPDRQQERAVREQPRDQGRDQGRDYDNRPRGQRPPRPMTEARQPAAEEPMNGLPAFITAPTRTAIEHAAPQDASLQNSPAPHEGMEQQAAPADGGNEAAHLRPRRRRRPKADFADKAEFAGEASSDARPMESPEPIGD